MISAVILTKNEEKNLKGCLETLKWCDGIVVVDDNSDDKTREIAQGMGAQVFTRSLNGDFASQRNFGLEKAKGDWVFFVDADERAEDPMAQEIKKATQDTRFTGYFVKRKDFMFGQWLNHGETANAKLLRLARKGAGGWTRSVHEVWDIRGQVGELQSPLLHYPHPTVAEFLQNIDSYTDVNAQEFYRQGTWVGVEPIILYPLGKFVVNYLLRLGFLDGMPGILMALIMSFHSFLTRSKLWLLQQNQAAK